MFLTLGLIFLALWLGGFIFFRSAGFIIHILLIAAIAMILLRIITGA